jgi:hypothetical protein
MHDRSLLAYLQGEAFIQPAGDAADHHTKSALPLDMAS